MMAARSRWFLHPILPKRLFQFPYNQRIVLFLVESTMLIRSSSPLSEPWSWHEYWKPCGKPALKSLGRESFWKWQELALSYYDFWKTMSFCKYSIILLAFLKHKVMGMGLYQQDSTVFLLRRLILRSILRQFAWVAPAGDSVCGQPHRHLSSSSTLPFIAPSWRATIPLLWRESGMGRR